MYNTVNNHFFPQWRASSNPQSRTSLPTTIKNFRRRTVQQDTTW